MRESNFAFPTQNKACVCITSQLYDRRALDTTSALPLLNSLTHLTYLTSTSPRIREIMTMDGGLERLVRILHDFCICPPPPENASLFYGLTSPTARPAKPIPTLNPHSFDKQAAYRFSLAFQCVVNIGVRGSEPIRSRVVQAGTLEVVGCILEAWLANKGFAVGPSSSASGLPRETREQRQARRDAHLLQRQREQNAQLERDLHRRLQLDQQQQHRQTRPALRLARLPGETTEEDESMDVSPGHSSGSQETLLLLSASTLATSGSDTEMSTDVSAAATPVGSGTPTGSVVIPSRDRSGTIIARPVWDPAPTPATNPSTATQSTATLPRYRSRRASPPSPTHSTDTSRPETETEDDGDGDVDMDRSTSTTVGGSSTRSRRIGSSSHTHGRSSHAQGDSDAASGSASPSPERHLPPHHHGSLGRRAVGIVSDDPPAGDASVSADVHIIIDDGVGGVGVGVGSVEDGIVSLEPNDDFAMGAPPGAPGAIDGPDAGHGNGAAGVMGLGLGMGAEGRRRATVIGGAGTDAPDVTPRAGVVSLPVLGGAGAHMTPGRTPGVNPHHHHHHHHQRATTARGREGPAAMAATPGRRSQDTDGAGPYRDEDVLLSLQLLAYLSKYPHVRQAFYKQRVTFHPASVELPGARYGVVNGEGSRVQEKERAGKETKEGGFFRAFGAAASATVRGKEREKAVAPTAPTSTTSSSTSPLTRQTNVFSLVERFTFKPSSTETDLPNPPPRLPPEIQYWAGVIMRNACRKDDSRGGIRQCANMICGRWEAYPREFAKCRRCRKAKYCGKECQSTAWSEGHRFWCSAKDGDEDAIGEQLPTVAGTADVEVDTVVAANTGAGGATYIPAREGLGIAGVGGADVGGGARAERRERHARDRERAQALATGSEGMLRGPGGGFRAPGSSGGASAANGGPVLNQSRGEVRERFAQPQSPAVSPHSSRTWVGGGGAVGGLELLRPRGTPSGTNNAPIQGHYFMDMYGEPSGASSGRRRAETVTGATMGGSGEVVLPTYLNSRLPPPTPVRTFGGPSPHSHSSDLRQLAGSIRQEAGPSRRRRVIEGGNTPGAGQFRMPADDNDMILG